MLTHIQEEARLFRNARNRTAEIPAYIYVMAIITFAYLTIEIPFSVHLVRVMGGFPTQAEIDNLESFGRVLTGVAVAIWVLGVVILPKLHKGYRSLAWSVAVSFIASSAITFGVYRALEFYADNTGVQSTATERHTAFKANLLRNYVATHGSGELRPNEQTDWLTFVSVMPALVSSEGLNEIDLDQLASMEASRKIGDISSLRETVDDAFYKASYAFHDYEKLSDEYSRAVEEQLEKSDRHWRGFRENLKRAYPDHDVTYSASHIRMYRDMFRREAGIELPASWHLKDRSTFDRVYRAMIEEKVNEVYSEKINEFEVGYLRPGMTREEFGSHPTVQKELRAALGLPAVGPAITPSMTDIEIKTAIYAPLYETLVSDLVSAGQASASEFSDSGEYADIGIDSVKAAKLPALAILLSIAGAALHIFKFTGYMLRILSPRIKHLSILGSSGRTRIGAAIAITGLIFVGMSISGNSVTASEDYQRVSASGVSATLLNGAISIQPQFSVLGDAIGTIGIWQIFKSGLPSPNYAEAPAEASANTSNTIEMAGNIPIPTPRPVHP